MYNSLTTIGLLVVANVFMTIAWYGHLRMRDFSWFGSLPLFAVILISWGVAFFEYCLQVPANRIGFQGNGGSFSLMQLKVIQEVITLSVFIVFSMIVFKVDVRWNHILAMLLMVVAGYLVFKK